MEKFLEQLHRSGTDFFSVFVRGLIDREANEKWIDRSGDRDVGSPLLTVDEHCELLSQIAISMWESRVDYLRRDNLEFVAEYFSELNHKGSLQAQQIRERLRGHALLVSSANATNAVEFDHDEFRQFFLGEGIARQIQPLSDRAKAEVLGTFRRGMLPRHTQHAIVRAIKREQKMDRLSVVRFLIGIAAMDGQASYTQQNCSDIIIRMLSELQGESEQIRGLLFGVDALRDRKLSGLSFHDCYFSPTSLEQTDLKNCTFSKCTFALMRLYTSTMILQVEFDNCVVEALILEPRNREVDTAFICQHLEQLGVRFTVVPPVNEDPPAMIEPDDEIRDIEKIVRYFMRSTHISESVMHIKLGAHGHAFIDKTLPCLLRTHVMQVIENRGGRDQRRFRLGVPLQQVNSAINASGGSFTRFLEQFVAAE